MTEGDLEAVVCRHSKRRQQRREGGADVGTQRHGQHLVDWQHADATQWRQSGGHHGTALHNEGQDAPHCHGQVVVHVGGFENDRLGPAQNEAVQQLHHTKEGHANHQQRQKEGHNATTCVTQAFQKTCVDDISLFHMVGEEPISIHDATTLFSTSCCDAGVAVLQLFYSGLIDVFPVHHDRIADAIFTATTGLAGHGLWLQGQGLDHILVGVQKLRHQGIDDDLGGGCKTDLLIARTHKGIGQGHGQPIDGSTLPLNGIH
mmetsp:Transcript_21883/g.45552  ORF Transcript_21883/g.45552 Transcript_21883/m.45552 type:complete len:260 (+) Transcript_21883:231-1010(+)